MVSQPDNSSDGSCKTTADYKADFAALENAIVRTYSSNDCDTAANILPAAAEAGVKVILGVWSVVSDIVIMFIHLGNGLYFLLT